MGTAKFTARRHSVRIPSAVPQAYAACAHLSLLLLPRRVSASRVLVSLKMIRFLLVHALLESTFGEVSMDTPGYSYCNALHRTESDDTCCEGGDISCGRRLSEEPAFKENLTAHGRSLGHCCDLAAFCECLQNYVAQPPSPPSPPRDPGHPSPPPSSPFLEQTALLEELEGHYFSFSTWFGNPADVVDRYEIRREGENAVRYYRNCYVGCTQFVDSATATPMEIYVLEGIDWVCYRHDCR